MSRLRFGEHVIDLDERTLTRGSARVALQSQPFELLRLLVERRGELVTRDDIRARLWSDTVVEYDLSINHAIRQIRAALGPDAAAIQTMPRRGYRFAAPVTSIAERRLATKAAVAAAALVLGAFASGFGAGLIARDQDFGQFVYVHLVHPDRCPYIRMFMPTHRNS
jgi:DNA-binding winged helix-turn-helix (wHTH) protein